MTHNDLIRSICDQLLEDVHTTIPAIVKGYDSQKQTVTVKVAVDRKVGDTKVIASSTLLKVPYVVPGNEDSVIFIKPKVNSLVLLVFCERNIDEFLESKGIVITPQFLRFHDEADAFAMPGVFVRSKPTRKENLRDKFHIAHKGSYISIDDNNIMDIKATDLNMDVGTLAVSNNMTVGGNLNVSGIITGGTVKTVAGVDLDLHTHPYTDTPLVGMFDTLAPTPIP